MDTGRGGVDRSGHPGGCGTSYRAFVSAMRYHAFMSVSMPMFMFICISSLERLERTQERRELDLVECVQGRRTSCVTDHTDDGTASVA